MRLVERTVLQEAAGKRTSLVEGEEGERLVLKRYEKPSREARLERAFLRDVADYRFPALEFPRVVDAGEDFLLVRYVDREHQTRDTILERDWPDEDVDLWVQGLLEFQTAPLPSRCFTLRQRLLGCLYPVFRACTLWKHFPRRLTAAGLMLRYALARPFFRNVAVHYDLQTYNYAFRRGARRMSLLDFEFSYYRGDPLFDVLYFATIPIVRLEDWTFQKRILRAFLARWRGSRTAWRARVRLILLVCNLARSRGFAGDSRAIYDSNVELISDSRRFAAWLDSVSSD